MKRDVPPPPEPTAVQKGGMPRRFPFDTMFLLISVAFAVYAIIHRLWK